MPVAAAGLLVTAFAMPAPAMPATSAVEAVNTDWQPETAAAQASRRVVKLKRGGITTAYIPSPARRVQSQARRVISFR
jgi:hypothetical protein